MITLKLKGGLGNQLFQYACGRALALRNGQKLALDVTGYTYQKPGSVETPRSFSLSPFAINVDEIIQTPHSGDHTHPSPSGEISLWTRIIRKITGNYHIGWDPSFFKKINAEAKAGKDIYLDGFWWSENYFSDASNAIREDLKLKSPLSPRAQEMSRIIEQSESIPVSIHIRRGDYVLDPRTNAYHGVCSKEYYDRALAHLVSQTGPRIQIFIFSDDIAWVKENMPFDYPTQYVSRPLADTEAFADYEELTLMSRCSHHIIANSSFSWWGAWLNPSSDKIVIAPSRWTQKKVRDSREMLPSSWIRI